MELDKSPGQQTPKPPGRAADPPAIAEDPRPNGAEEPGIEDPPAAGAQGPPDGAEDPPDVPPAGAQEPTGRTEEPSASAAAGGSARRPGKVGRGPGRNLPIAIGVGAALGALVLLSVYLVKWVFVAVMALFLGVALREMTGALASRGIRVPFVPLAAGLLAMLVLPYTSGPRGLLAAFGLTVLLLLIWRMQAGARDYVRDTTASLFTAVYIPFLGGFAVLMLASSDGADRIVTFIALTVSSDIGGFFAGTFLGRHTMAPSISPKKTWEGFAGSGLACMLIGALLLPLLLDGQIWHGIVLGAAVVSSATLGDLIESMIKRDLGIKDMGRLLPGHGGVLDRLDSLLATAPAVWVVLHLLV